MRVGGKEDKKGGINCPEVRKCVLKMKGHLTRFDKKMNSTKNRFQQKGSMKEEKEELLKFGKPKECQRHLAIETLRTRSGQPEKC